MANGTADKNDSMFADTQKGLAWFICVSFVALIFVWVFFPPTMKPESMAQLNNLVSTLVTIVALAIGYFFGSSRSSKDKDDQSAKVAEKLADKVGATQPAGANVPVPPWWARLKDDEKNTITAAGNADPRVAAFVTASMAGAATADDLTYLVTKGLLTQDRATAIAAT